ncbi:hypothetical protein DUNSADRAFT_8725 [Dunaliella salina]|uniref:Secreted protein n=1 Tax=Dunaliella salina TaxID=3046 RepID=A0ABQ7GIW9_DUNSA|nr:hypothetical protein DUNSADRAFT_8725 [Dunaliella salina]|eukprot:KAF5834558.1 hypothetical protein DUNSADRAFT_8725 [Dunaliella salina]
MQSYIAVVLLQTLTKKGIISANWVSLILTTKLCDSAVHHAWMRLTVEDFLHHAMHLHYSRLIYAHLIIRILSLYAFTPFSPPDNG